MAKKSKYGHLSREQIEARLEKLEKEGYGLKWEDKPEAVADLCDTQLPVLKEDKAKELISDPNLPTNYIIEGDNYHSLFTLNFTHKKQIDVIYIDPPYNTGKKNEWKYNDHWIDENDTYRHSKWLSFMNKRLRLAKQLLKDEGVIFISIDDNEVAQLKLLCDKIFREHNILNFGIVNKSSEIATNYTIKKHEYILSYCKNLTKLSFDSVPKYTISRGTVGNENQTMPVIEFPKGLNCYNIKDGIYKTTRKVDGGNENIENLDPIIVKNGKLAQNVRLKARWRSSNDMRNFFKNNCEPTKAKINGIIEEIYFENDKFNPQIKKNTFEKLSSLYLDYKRGSKDLENLDLKGKFENPKQVEFIKYLLKLTTKKDSLILDFFAGSGTTAQAVMELNEDGCNRKFILCTNNENNICTEVTYPRVKKVIEGYSNKEGIPANVKYFTQTFVNQVTSDKDKRELVNRSTELLCMAENTFDVISKRNTKNDFAIFGNTEKITSLIYDESQIEDCVNKLNQLNNGLPAIIYVFSYDHTYYTEDFINLKIKFIVKPIPEAILNVYRKIAKLRKK
jgi:adenine-specific DNA-methyltransferase